MKALQKLSGGICHANWKGLLVNITLYYILLTSHLPKYV